MNAQLCPDRYCSTGVDADVVLVREACEERDYKGLHAFPSNVTRDGPPITRDCPPSLLTLQGQPLTHRGQRHLSQRTAWAFLLAASGKLGHKPRAGPSRPVFVRDTAPTHAHAARRQRRLAATLCGLARPVEVPNLVRSPRGLADQDGGRGQACEGGWVFSGGGGRRSPRDATPDPRGFKVRRVRWVLTAASQRVAPHVARWRPAATVDCSL